MVALTRYHELVQRILYSDDTLAEFYALRNSESYETFKIFCWHLKDYISDSKKVEDLFRFLRSEGRHFNVTDEDVYDCIEDGNPKEIANEYSKIRYIDLKNDHVATIRGLCDAVLNDTRYNQAAIPKYFSFEKITHPDTLANELVSEGFVFESQISVLIKIFRNQFKGNDPLIWRSKLRPFEFFIGRLSKSKIIDPNDCWSFLKTHKDIFHIITKGEAHPINPKSLGKISEADYSTETILNNPVLASLHIIISNVLGE